MKRMTALLFLAVFVTIAASCLAAGPKWRRPGPADKCPVCGMLVAKYTDFTSQLQFRDGSVVFFDGPKDMFKYYHGLPIAGAKKKRTDIAAVLVTGYYTLLPIDGLKAYYVTGSDVFGPMGRELIAFDKETDAREFIKDHRGKAVLRFGGVGPAVLKELER